MKHQRPPRQHTAFSLIELLITVMILAVLAALGLGGLATLRGKAAQSKCTANLRTITLGLAGYIQEFGYYPGAMPDNTVALRYWYHILEPYVTGGAIPDKDAPPSPWMQCPLKKEPEEHEGYSYGYNYYGFGHAAESRGGWETEPYRAKYWHVRPASVQEPGKKIVVGDNSDGSGKALFLYNSSGSTGTYAHRHNDGGNYLFADGHVEWLKADEIMRLAARNSKSIFTPFP